MFKTEFRKCYSATNRSLFILSIQKNATSLTRTLLTLYDHLYSLLRERFNRSILRVESILFI